MTFTEKHIFDDVLEQFQIQYPHRNIKYSYETCIEVDGELEFNTDGYNLLYNLKRLCDVLQDELR